MNKVIAESLIVKIYNMETKLSKAHYFGGLSILRQLADHDKTLNRLMKNEGLI